MANSLSSHNTRGSVTKLPVWSLFKACYQCLWQRKADVCILGLLLLVLSATFLFILDAVNHTLLQNIESLSGSTVFFKVSMLWGVPAVLVTAFLFYTCYYVWIRCLLLQKPLLSQENLTVVATKHFWAFCLWFIVLHIFYSVLWLPFVCLTGVIAFVVLSAEPAMLFSPLLGLLVLAGCACFFLSLWLVMRFVLAPFSLFSGEKSFLKHSWRVTKGNACRLFLGMFLVLAPCYLVLWGLSLLSVFLGMPARSPSLIWLVPIAINAAYGVLAFKCLSNNRKSGKVTKK
ncbi:MAG: hypothetical protein V6Z78_04285 [Holosporaceae bacterium]